MLWKICCITIFTCVPTIAFCGTATVDNDGVIFHPFNSDDFMYLLLPRVVRHIPGLSEKYCLISTLSDSRMAVRCTFDRLKTHIVKSPQEVI